MSDSPDPAVIAKEAALEAGKLLMQHFEKASSVSFKGKNDIVTEVDIRSNELIRSKIMANFPDHSIHSEETGLEDHHSKYTWIIDPIDGTIVPNQITAKLCDKITFTNEDGDARYLMFGSFEEPEEYAGEDMLTIRNGRPKTLVLTEPGTHHFHDHSDPETTGGFTVTAE